MNDPAKYKRANVRHQPQTQEMLPTFALFEKPVSQSSCCGADTASLRQFLTGWKSHALERFVRLLDSPSKFGFFQVSGIIVRYWKLKLVLYNLQYWQWCSAFYPNGVSFSLNTTKQKPMRAWIRKPWRFLVLMYVGSAMAVMRKNGKKGLLHILFSKAWDQVQESQQSALSIFTSEVFYARCELLSKLRIRKLGIT